MAPQADIKILFCIFLIACCVTVTLQQVPIDCCLETANRRFDKSVVVDYREQRSGEGCAIAATIMVTKRGKTLCMSANGSWVRSVKHHVDQLRKHCQKHSFQDTRCVGVRNE